MLPVENESKFSVIRKYFVEYTVLALIAAVGFLFKDLSDLNKYIRENFESTIQKNNEVLYKATNATEQFINFQKYQQDDKRNH